MKPRSNNDLVTGKISIMNVLFILLYFQFSGIIVSFLQSYIRNSIDNRKIITNTKKLIFQKRKNEQWLIDYFQEHPKKIFKQNFPEIYKLSVAIKKYKKINLLRKKELLTNKEYEKRLEEILPLIDISLLYN